MSIIVNENLIYNYNPLPEASNYCIKIHHKYLSSAYKLNSKDEVYGEIIKIYDYSNDSIIEIPEIKKRELKFILRIEYPKNLLFFSENDWEILREYGVLEENFSIKIAFKRAIKGIANDKRTTIFLYTKRNLDLTK